MKKNEIIKLVDQVIFPEKDQGQKLIETSISWVIIGRKYVYKLKKPVRFSFLDFSTLRKRKFYCEEEIRLNRRLAEGIYLSILTVYHNKKYQVREAKNQAAAPAIDYVIKMKKMNLSKQMNFLIEKNKVTKEHIQRIAIVVSEFHHNATRIYSPFNTNEELLLFNDILTTMPLLESHLDKPRIEKIHFCLQKAREFLSNNEKLLKKRSEEGFIRDCHGDMHTGNIFLYKKPIIFDCIEFSKKLRQIDIISEIAFLCMDMESFDKHELSSYFIKAYREEDLSADHLFPILTYYKMQKANVRVKVNALSASQNLQGTTFNNDLKEAIKYIDLMYKYAVHL